MKYSNYILGILTVQIICSVYGLFNNQDLTGDEMLILTINTCCYFILKNLENNKK